MSCVPNGILRWGSLNSFGNAWLARTAALRCVEQWVQYRMGQVYKWYKLCMYDKLTLLLKNNVQSFCCRRAYVFLILKWRVLDTQPKWFRLVVLVFVLVAVVVVFCSYKLWQWKSHITLDYTVTDIQTYIHIYIYFLRPVLRGFYNRIVLIQYACLILLLFLLLFLYHLFTSLGQQCVYMLL